MAEFGASTEVHRDGHHQSSGANESAISGVSWAAIIAGAFGAGALSIILMMLGFGLGLSSVSPWSYAGITAGSLGIAAIIWLMVTQIIASGLGGYLSGRLRTRWVNVHTDEVFFRDTAHGFLAWAVATIMTAAFLTNTIGAVVGGTMQSPALATSSHMRSDIPQSKNSEAPNKVDSAISSAMENDRNVSTQTKQEADEARKVAATAALWMFVALLCGAFTASYAATWGGRYRNNIRV